MTIHSLNQTGEVGEAVGYVAEAVEEGSEMILVVCVREDGRLDGHGFGPVTFADLCLFGTYLQHRAMRYVDGPQDDD